MKCYKLFPDFRKDVPSLNYQLSPDKNTPAIPEPGQIISLYGGVTYMPDWRLTEETERELQRMYVLINPKLLELPDFWGSFSPVIFKDSTSGPEMISPALQTMLNELIPGKFETVPAGPIIDRTHGREITDHGHVYATFLEERDTYDREETRIKPFTRGDGRTFLEVRSSLPTIDARAAKGGVIWREAVDGALVVSDRFKDAFENIGGKGVRFHPLPMSHL
jgi:hypothetical protein